jgi:hypothetical protein
MTLGERNEVVEEERVLADESRCARDEHHVVRCPKSPPA